MRAAVYQLVESAIAELNRELEYPELEKIDETTRLVDGEGGLDSLSLVTLIVAIEDDVRHEFDLDVALADEKAMSRANSPYRTVGSLVDFIVEILEDANA